MMGWKIGLAVSVALNLVAIWGLYNAAQKVNYYDQYCEMVVYRLRQIIANIRAIDLRGAFEADDEVGSVFADIAALILSLQVFLPEGEDDEQKA
jgi:hypothetical protein